MLTVFAAGILLLTLSHFRDTPSVPWASISGTIHSCWVQRRSVFILETEHTFLFLVGYQLTLDVFQKVKQLEIEKILLPHYGAVDREEAEVYLENSETAVRETAKKMHSMLKSGSTSDEILAYFEERDYRKSVKLTYPIDALHLNTSIMIEQIRKELLKLS